MLKTIEAAFKELDAMEQDMLAEGYEGNYSDLVEALMIDVEAKLRAEVCRRTLGYVPTWAK